MQAKNIRAGVHSVGGKNIASTHRYGNTVGLVYADGTSQRFHADSPVFVQPARDANGKFLPREYLLMMAIDGVDIAVSYTGRNTARRWKKVWADAYGITATMVAI